MSETLEEIKQYKKKIATVEALKWDGSLNSVPDVINWVLEKDPNASVNAKFTSLGINLEITTGSQQLLACSTDYVVYGEDFGLARFTEAQFNAIYEAV